MPAKQLEGMPTIQSAVGILLGTFAVIGTQKTENSFSATVTNSGDADSRIWSRHWTFYVATIAPCILG